MKVVVALLLLLVGCSALPEVVSTPAIDRDLGTSSPLELQGRTRIEAGFEAARALGPEAVRRTVLTAAEVTIDLTWQRGVEVRSGASLMKRVIDQGNETVELSNAQIGLEITQGEPLIFAFGEAAGIRGTAFFAESARIASGTEETPVSVGRSPDTVASTDQESPGFWFRTSADLAKATGAGDFAVLGNFTVFVHDVLIDATGDQGEWSDWTGYREDDPDARVTEYELRVTQITVTQGRLSTGSDEGIDLYLPSLAIDLDGSLTTFGVTGAFVQDGLRHVFSDSPLVLDGQGLLSVVAEPAGEILPATLRFAPDGEFRVAGATRVEAVDGDRVVDGAGSFRMTIAGLAAAVVATVGLVAGGVLPGPTTGIRDRQSATWRRRGRNALDVAAWRRASTCFTFSTFVTRRDPVAWYERAQAELERGRPAKTERLAGRAMSLPGADHLDLLDLRAAAAWEMGDTEKMLRLLAELADQAPAMARLLVEELGLDRSDLAGQVAGIFSASTQREVLDGYV